MSKGVVFVSSTALSNSATEAMLAQLRASMPSYDFQMLPSGVALSRPFDVETLCESVALLHKSVSELVEVNQQLLASNQEMLAEIIEMHAAAEETPSPGHHLGLSSLG